MTSLDWETLDGENRKPDWIAQEAGNHLSNSLCHVRSPPLRAVSNFPTLHFPLDVYLCFQKRVASRITTNWTSSNRKYSSRQKNRAKIRCDYISSETFFRGADLRPAINLSFSNSKHAKFFHCRPATRSAQVTMSLIANQQLISSWRQNFPLEWFFILSNIAQDKTRLRSYMIAQLISSTSLGPSQ